ncbi:MAG: hypothetical protein ACR2MZ_05240, partial [Candidatus Dormibacter sp.]|uniref:hypothetical protein n=1 Tax=Candidatus Dormibacter sp. TaxID=2973982 RepID=UPI003D9B7DE3
FAELADNLLRGVLSAFHFGSSLPSRAVLEPSYQMDQFSGVRSASQAIANIRDRLESELPAILDHILPVSRGWRWP